MRALAAGTLLALTAPLAAQGKAATARVVTGKVVRATESRVLPVPGEFVVLHRIGSDSARPLDSVRTRADGGFRIPYHVSGAKDAIYFVATKFAGIAYFSTPLRAPGADQSAVLTVFDTTSLGAPLPVRGRHVVVFAPGSDGRREVAEVYDIENVSAKTRVAAGGGHPSWSVPIPEDGADFKAGESDVSAGMIIGSPGKAEVFAPFAPGIKQIRFSYKLPRAAFPITLTPNRDTLVLEVLMEDPAANAVGGGLRRMDSVTVDERHFARWLAPSSPGGSQVRLATSGSSRRRMPIAVMALVAGLALMMILAILVGVRRRS